MNDDTLARITARFALTNRDLVCVHIILRGHPERDVGRALYDFIRGIGPAAVMRARTPTRRTWADPPAPLPSSWRIAPSSTSSSIATATDVLPTAA